MEEQLEEVEVLKCIYDDRLVEVGSSPISLRIVGIKGFGVGLDLEVEFTETYPHELPKFSILVVSGKLADADALRSHVMREAEGSLGMVMVFTLVTSIEEWLALNMRDTSKEKSDALQAELLKKKKEEEEDIPIELRGGPVTAQSFEAWRIKFMLEVSQKREETAAEVKKSLESKLTGIQLFKQNKALATSDVTFAPDELVVDEDVFDGLDDLDIQEGGLNSDDEEFPYDKEDEIREE